MAGRSRRLPCVACAVIVLAMGRSGYAELEYSISAGTSAGASDNPKSQPAEASPTTTAFATARGRFELSHIGRLTLERVSYGMMATTWIQGTSSSSLTHMLRLSSEIEASPATRLTLNGGATLARMSMLDTAAAADPQSLGPRPAGDQQFVTVDGGQSVAWEIGGAWRLDQSLQGRLYRPIGGDAALATNESLSLDAQLNHLWQRDWAGLRSRLGAMRSKRNAQDGQPLAGPNNNEYAELALTWRHDWTADLSHQLAAGVFVLETDRSPRPSALASVRWQRTVGEIELRAGRTVDSNTYIGAAYQRSFVGLRIALPIDRYEQLRLLTDANLEHDSTTGAGDGAAGSADVFAVRAGLQWQPGDYFAFGLEYTFREQRPSSAGAVNSPFATLRRQMALLTIDVRYPSGR